MFKNFYLLITVLSTFTAINSCNHVVQILLLVLCYQWRNWGTIMSNDEPKSLRWKMVEPRVQPGGLGGEELLISLFLKGVQWRTKKNQTDWWKEIIYILYLMNKAWQTPSLQKRKVPLWSNGHELTSTLIFLGSKGNLWPHSRWNWLICSQTFPGWSQDWDGFS